MLCTTFLYNVWKNRYVHYAVLSTENAIIDSETNLENVLINVEGLGR